MRLLHYNVLFDDIHLQLLEDIMLQADPDIITFNEVQPEEMELLQKKGYRTFFAETAKAGKHYGNGIAWKKQFTPRSIQTIVQDLTTPLIIWETAGFTVYVTHLNCKEGEEKRFQEIQKIISFTKPNSEYLLAGDLNCLSPHDGYRVPELEEGMRQHGHQRFGIPVRYKVVPYLEKLGLVDLLQKSGSRESTAPTREGTPEKEKKIHFRPFRIDYVFATKTLAEKVQRAYVLKNELTEKCSDHYPLVVEM